MTNLHDIWNGALFWSQQYIFSVSALYQDIILLTAFVFGSLAYRVARTHLDQHIDTLKISPRFKRHLKNLKKLITPVVTLVFAALMSQIASSPIFSLDTRMLDSFIKIILAWIIISCAVEFIANKVVRDIFAFAILIIAILSIFHVLPQTMAALDEFGFSFGKFRFSALNVIKGALALFVLLYLAQLASSLAERQILRNPNLTRSSQVLISKILRVLLLVLAVIIAITSAGIDLSVFAVLSGAIGLGIGFGLQKVVSNLFSGMLLLMDKSIKPGDVIEIEDSNTFGWVNHMGARYTEIITRDNKSYLIPNEDFVTHRVINWSHGNNQLVRISVEFRVHYGADAHKVIEIATQAAAKPVRVIDEPKPECWMLGFGESSLNFVVRFWIKDAEGGIANVKGEVLLALWDELKKNKIEIPYPHRVIHMAKD